MLSDLCSDGKEVDGSYKTAIGTSMAALYNMLWLWLFCWDKKWGGTGRESTEGGAEEVAEGATS